MGIDVERIEGILGDFDIDFTISFDLSKISDPSEQSIGNSWCSSTPSGNLYGGLGTDGNIEDIGTALQDGGQQFSIVIFQTTGDPKTSPHGGSQ